MYQLEIKDVGKSPKPIYVFRNGQKVPAMFYDKRDAEEAKRIVEKLRIDTAFEWVRVV